MEKSNKPVNTSWFGLNDQEGETVDADLLFDLLDTFKKDNVLTGKIRLTASEQVNTTETDNDESQEKKSVRESTESLFTNSDPIIHESNMSEIGSINETRSSEESGSNEESGLINWLESSFTNLPNVENEKEQNVANSEIEEEEEEEKSERSEEEESSERSLSESEEKSNLEKLLATQEKYELYCPNCSSCITRKVILMRRKSGKHVDLSTDLKSDVPVSEPDTPSEIEEMDNIEDDVQDGKEEGIIFACLTCLKSFIQLGTRFLQLDFIRGKSVEELGVTNSTNITQSLPQIQQDRERFIIELLKSTIYGGLTETITSLGVVSSASASGSSTENILALAVANLAGGLIILAQNLQDLINNSDRYEELLGRRANFKIHILVAVMSYIFFGLIPPLVYAFSFYKTGIKNYKLMSVFLVSLFCVILLGMIKVYVRKPRNSCESRKSYLKSAAFYTSLVVASSGISYVVGDFMGEYVGKLNWTSVDQVGINSPFDEIKSKENRFSSI